MTHRFAVDGWQRLLQYSLTIYAGAGFVVGLLAMRYSNTHEGGYAPMSKAMRGGSCAIPRLLPQALQYAVWDVTFRTEVQRGALPLSPGATLTWLAFSDQGTLCVMDSDGCAGAATCAAEALLHKLRCILHHITTVPILLSSPWNGVTPKLKTLLPSPRSGNIFDPRPITVTTLLCTPDRLELSSGGGAGCCGRARPTLAARGCSCSRRLRRARAPRSSGLCPSMRPAASSSASCARAATSRGRRCARPPMLIQCSIQCIRAGRLLPSVAWLSDACHHFHTAHCQFDTVCKGC